MKLELIKDGKATAVVVTLSRRNLLALLHKLSVSDSNRAVISPNAYRQGELVNDLILVVQAEDDDKHYSGRGFPPGAMHPSTEAFLALWGRARRTGTSGRRRNNGGTSGNAR